MSHGILSLQSWCTLQCNASSQCSSGSQSYLHQHVIAIAVSFPLLFVSNKVVSLTAKAPHDRALTLENNVASNKSAPPRIWLSVKMTWNVKRQQRPPTTQQTADLFRLISPFPLRWQSVKCCLQFKASIRLIIDFSPVAVVLESKVPHRTAWWALKRLIRLQYLPGVAIPIVIPSGNARALQGRVQIFWQAQMCYVSKGV